MALRLLTHAHPTALRKSAPAYNATFPVVLDLVSAGPCWFNLRPGTVAGFGANSPSFNVLGQERSSGPMVFGPSSTPTASTSSTTTITTTSAATTSRTGTSAATTPAPGSESGTSSSVTPTPTAVSTANGGGLSAAAAAGVGAGVAVGVLAFAGGVFAWFWRRRRRNRIPPEREQPKYVSQPVEGHQWQDQYWPQKASAVVELSSTIAPVEIASSHVHPREHELPA
jgi:hypothetical protein